MELLYKIPRSRHFSAWARASLETRHRLLHYYFYYLFYSFQHQIVFRRLSPSGLWISLLWGTEHQDQALMEDWLFALPAPGFTGHPLLCRRGMLSLSLYQIMFFVGMFSLSVRLSSQWESRRGYGASWMPVAMPGWAQWRLFATTSRGWTPRGLKSQSKTTCPVAEAW